MSNSHPRAFDLNSFRRQIVQMKKRMRDDDGPRQARSVVRIEDQRQAEAVPADRFGRS